MFEEIIKGTVLDKWYLGNRLGDYLVSLLIIVIGIVAALILKKISLALIRRFTKGNTGFYNMIETSFRQSIIPAIYIGLIYFSFELLRLQRNFDKLIYVIVIVLITILAIRFISTLMKYLIISALDRRDSSLTQTQAYRSLFPALQVILWLIGLIFVLDNLGVKITGIITGLGIGGIAIALAAQAVFKDFFSYIAIILDKPFEIGDSISVDTFSGTVEHIGIKTTRLRSTSGEQLVFSNSNLTDSRIKNYQKLRSRRVSFFVSVAYETPVEKLREIPGIIKGLIEGYPDTEFDRCHFAAYGDSGLSFETVYYVTVSDYNRYMDIQQEIYLNLYQAFQSGSIEFSYPTRRVIMDKTGGEEQGKI